MLELQKQLWLAPDLLNQKDSHSSTAVVLLGRVAATSKNYSPFTSSSVQQVDQLPPGESVIHIQ